MNLIEEVVFIWLIPSNYIFSHILKKECLRSPKISKNNHIFSQSLAKGCYFSWTIFFSLSSCIIIGHKYCPFPSSTGNYLDFSILFVLSFTIMGNLDGNILFCNTEAAETWERTVISSFLNHYTLEVYTYIQTCTYMQTCSYMP